MTSKYFTAWSIILLMCFVSTAPAAEQVLKPYLLGYRGAGAAAGKLAEVKTDLAARGFQVVGEYEPYKGAHILAVTSDALKAAAAGSDFGAYGAVMRVSITEVGKEIQVAAMNPRYYAAAYRMQGSLADIAASLEQAIGKTADFGSRGGMTEAQLRKYHYMVMMPYFTDQIKLATYPTQDKALSAVALALDAKTSGTTKIYRVDLPGRQESVFGVALSGGDGDDAAIMKVVDIGELKHTPHLPYELVVAGGSVYMLHGKFRIALDFPDLTMGTFMKISGAPSAIEEKLKAVAMEKSGEAPASQAPRMR